MWSTILPELMSITVFVLALLCLQAGHSPSHLQDYAILSFNSTGLKDNYHKANAPAGLPIHDEYKVFMMTHCEGYYSNGYDYPLVAVDCSSPSAYCAFPLIPHHYPTLLLQKLPELTSAKAQFLPYNLFQQDLSDHSATINVSALHLPSGIQDAFNERFNLQLHVAFIFYLIALIWLGIVILWGLIAFWFGVLASFAILFTSVCLPSPSFPHPFPASLLSQISHSERVIIMLTSLSQHPPAS
jgi:hypothetical protein